MNDLTKTDFIFQTLATVCRILAISCKMWPKMEEQFRFFLNYGKVFNWINTKFSAFVHHMSGLNWTKNFSHCSISGPVAPSSMPKLKTPLATIFVEKKFWKKFWWGSRPNWVTPWKEFVISWKKWRFEIFQTSVVSRANGSWILHSIT